MKKILVANRGEIACRIIAAAKAAQMRSVAVFSKPDENLLHVKHADEAVCIGEGPPNESYLSISKILDAAKKTGADAIHPGYGFLSERAEFAKAVKKAGLIWIGPDAKVIELMGNKIAAKKEAEKAKVPTLPWAILGEKYSDKELLSEAKRIGLPLLLKAAAGGGGRGMRLVSALDELKTKAESASHEALAAFGSGELFLEKYCPAGRHIEVQVIGDEKGNVYAIGERECSVQRRHQKVIEEAPAANLSEKTKTALHAAAVSLAKSVGYVNAGTCEFLVDQDEGFYFLEINTRLQVEHPVTELVFGVDLPVLQIEVACGKTLPKELKTLSPRGHAIEARVYAEDPSKGFMPSPGVLGEFTFAMSPRLRVDTGYAAGLEIPIFYDAMLAKVISWGMNREQARETLLASLEKSVITGVAVNQFYLVDILRHPSFIDARVTTDFLEKKFSGWKGITKVESHKKNQSASSTETISPWFYFSKSKTHASTPSSVKTDQTANTDSDELLPLVAEYPGKVLKVLVKKGQKISANEVVVICESMKMEFSYSANKNAKVKNVLVTAGEVITAGTLLVEWEDL